MWVKVLKEKTFGSELTYPHGIRKPSVFRNLLRVYTEQYFEVIYNGPCNANNSFSQSGGEIIIKEEQGTNNSSFFYKKYAVGAFVCIWNNNERVTTNEPDYIANITNLDVQTFKQDPIIIKIGFILNAYYMYGDIARFSNTLVSRVRKYTNGTPLYETEVEKPRVAPRFETEYTRNKFVIVAQMQFFDSEGTDEKRSNYMSIIHTNFDTDPTSSFYVDYEHARYIIALLERSKKVRTDNWSRITGRTDLAILPERNYDVIKYYLIPADYFPQLEQEYTRFSVFYTNLHTGVLNPIGEENVLKIETLKPSMEISEVFTVPENVSACGVFGAWLPIIPKMHNATQQGERKLFIDDDLHLFYNINGTEVDATTAFLYNAPFTGQNATEWADKQRAYFQAVESQKNAEQTFEISQQIQEASLYWKDATATANIPLQMGSTLINAGLSSNPYSSLAGGALSMVGSLLNTAISDQGQEELNTLQNKITSNNLKLQKRIIEQNKPRARGTPQTQTQNALKYNVNGLIFVYNDSTFNTEYAEKFGFECSIIVKGNLEEVLNNFYIGTDATNYIQTSGCDVVDVPPNTSYFIEQMFNNGVEIYL